MSGKIDQAVRSWKDTTKKKLKKAMGDDAEEVIDMTPKLEKYALKHQLKAAEGATLPTQSLPKNLDESDNRNRVREANSRAQTKVH